MVARAGAGTVNECCQLGVPTLYVPLPGTSGDEQTANARLVERAGGAMVLPQAMLTGERLERELRTLVADPARLKQMGERGITLEIDDSAKEWLAHQGYDSAYGARPLRRAIQRHIEDPLSEEVLRGEFPQGGVVQIKLAGEELVFLAKQEDAVESLSDS